MITSLLLAALTSVLPVGGESIALESWIQDTDFSLAAMANQSDAMYELSFDEDGKAYRCEMVKPARNDLMNKTICRSLLKRARKQPFVDGKGRALPLVSRGIVKMRYAAQDGLRTGRSKTEAAIEFSTELVPAAAAAEYVDLFIIMDEYGKVESCALREESHYPSVNAKACEIAALAQYAIPVKGASGASVRGARNYDILFRHGTTGLR